MKRKNIVNFILSLLLVLSTGCNAARVIAPLPQSTSVPSPTTLLFTPSPLPTLGDLEYLDAGYCLEDENPDDELNLLRFFPSGVVLMVITQGQKSCQDAWVSLAPYLIEADQQKFSHGIYQFSGTAIHFSLAPAYSDQVAGVVLGSYQGDRLLLLQQGVEMEYMLVYRGELP